MSFFAMAEGFYKLWYKEKVSMNLTNEQKIDIAKRISELTLKSPIWLDKSVNYIVDFPELKPYSSNGFISGLQLCTIMKEIVNEMQQKGEN